MNATATVTATTQRLLSLDVFRGLTIVGMIIVNDAGDWNHIYTPLHHADWHGITATDLVFPFFLFIVGVSIVLAYTKRLDSNTAKSSLTSKILSRTAIIFGLGVFLNLFPEFDFSNIRIPGVLQRIALVFMACSFIFLYTSWKMQIKLLIGLLVGYWAFMTLIPVPGYGWPNIDTMEGNLASWLDYKVIPGVLYKKIHDPEGLMSTLPSIASGITGLLTGKLLISSEDADRKLIWIMVLGFVAMTIGNVWDWFFPFNKNLWTSSYVMYTSGLAAMTLGAIYWFVDRMGYQFSVPFFRSFGVNAITAYVFHGVIGHLFQIPFGSGEQAWTINTAFMDGFIGMGLAPKFVSLMWALAYTALCFVPIWIMYKKKIFVKI